MGRSSKRKGSHYEREIVKLHEAEGIVARKVPLSGALAEMPGDVIVADHFRGEVKARTDANGFKKVRDWLADNDLLFLREIGKGQDPLVVMHWDLYLQLLQLWGEKEDQP